MSEMNVTSVDVIDQVRLDETFVVESKLRTGKEPFNKIFLDPAAGGAR